MRFISGFGKYVQKLPAEVKGLFYGTVFIEALIDVTRLKLV